jgi:translation initiation factor 4B
MNTKACTVVTISLTCFLGYAPRDSGPQRLPDKPPYTAHLGNLSYDATVETVTDFFTGCDLTSVRIIEDREQQRPKGFAYAEFANLDGLKKALTLDGSSFQGRTIKIKIADPRMFKYIIEMFSL